jgi:pimeloyl-ACP methyl ester carboxylesterase
MTERKQKQTLIKHEACDFWKNYMERWFGQDLIEKWHKYVTEDWIESNGQTIHLEVYDTGTPEAPTIVFTHGIAGYARILLPFLVPLRERSYNIVAPDLQGYGYTAGAKGAFEWNIHVQNICDTLCYARSRFSGKLVVGGASMGGPLAYAAACKFKDVDALACWCLWDFNDREFMLNETNTNRFTYVLLPIAKTLASITGSVKLKTYKLISYDTLSDSQELVGLLKSDPQAGTQITLKGAISLLLQSKPILPYSGFKIPVLVVQPGADEMTPVKYAKAVFNLLGSEKKTYIELVGAAHFPTQRAYYEVWAKEFDIFMKRVL